MNEYAKNTLRQYFREQRQNASDKEIMSKIIVSHIKNFEIYRKSQLPVLYWAVKNEVSLFEICRERWENKLKFGLPRCIDKNGEMEMFIANESEMSPDCHGISSPLHNKKNSILPTEIDLIFVPAVAFDIFGNRLGQGGGYYDRFLPKCPNAVKIGVCFSCQLSKDLFLVSELDEKVDFVITEKGVSECLS